MELLDQSSLVLEINKEYILIYLSQFLEFAKEKKIFLMINLLQYIYLGVLFNESLDLESIIVKMNDKINHIMNSFFRFLTNRNVPFYFKTRVLVLLYP